jgi:hypothetical protein
MPNQRVGVGRRIDAHDSRKAWRNTGIPPGGFDELEHPLGDLAVPLQQPAREVEPLHRRARVQKVRMMTRHDVDVVPERIQRRLQTSGTDEAPRAHEIRMHVDLNLVCPSGLHTDGHVASSRQPPSQHCVAVSLPRSTG